MTRAQRNCDQLCVCVCETLKVNFILLELFLEAISVALESVSWKACVHTKTSGQELLTDR